MVHFGPHHVIEASNLQIAHVGATVRQLQFEMLILRVLHVYSLNQLLERVVFDRGRLVMSLSR